MNKICRASDQFLNIPLEDIIGPIIIKIETIKNILICTVIEVLIFLIPCILTLEKVDLKVIKVLINSAINEK